MTLIRISNAELSWIHVTEWAVRFRIHTEPILLMKKRRLHEEEAPLQMGLGYLALR